MNRFITTRYMLTLLSLCLACGMFTFGCSGSHEIPQQSISSEFPITIIDSNGKSVTLNTPPERIVVIDSDSVEILFDIGQGWRIVGTHEFVEYPPEALDIQRVGSAFALNLEHIVELEPDLVYLFYDRFLPEIENLGITVLYINSLNTKITDVFELYQMWGVITANEEISEMRVATLTKELKELEILLSTVETGPRVYHHTGGFWTAGGDTLVGDVYRFLKAVSVSDGISGYIQITPEEILSFNPEIIISPEETRAEIMANTALQKSSAVKNGNVINTSDGSLYVAGPRIVNAIKELGAIFYPELFDQTTNE